MVKIMAELTPVYMIMVDPDNNGTDSNKGYEMHPLGDGTFKARWGRIGQHYSEKIYPMSKWNSLYNSKLKKGYKETTSLMTDVIRDSKVEDTNKSDKFASIVVASIRDVLRRLWEYSHSSVQSAYKVSASVVTQAMVDKAQEQIDFISTQATASMDVEEFNKALLELFSIIPRKMGTVKSWLAKSPNDFDRIIVREQDLLDSMAGQVYKHKVDDGTKSETEVSTEVNILDEMGIEMRETTPDEVAKLKKLMGNQAYRFVNAWAVNNIETNKEFTEFVSKNKIGNVRLLCHGSRNQNWLSIIKQGIRIRPSNAISTGNLFGLGCYWSNPEKYEGGVQKSVGYTSVNGSYWASGNSSRGFIAFYDVAIGKSYDVYSFGSQYYDFNLKKLKSVMADAWSLWCHGQGHRNGGSSLINDEIIVYDHRQATIRYLVEIK